MIRHISPCSTLLSKIPTNSIEWIDNSIQKIFSPSFKLNKGDKQSFASIITVLIDVSASTNNLHGSRRGSSRFTNSNIDNPSDNEFKSESGTDPIIVAEIKGVIYYLCELATNYDLTGTILQIYTFSNILSLSGECEIDDYDSLSLFIQNISKILSYDFGSTNLMDPIKYICEDKMVIGKKTHIVLATDGQPNINGSTQDIIKYLQNLPTNVYDNLTMAIIGAGSIQLSQGGGKGFRSIGNKHTQNQFAFDNDFISMDNFCKLLFSSQSNSHSECNIRFLIDIMNILQSSCYLPSFGDYSSLKESAIKYLNSTDTFESNLQYKVLLDNSVINLPQNIQTEIHNHKYIISYNQSASGWYLYNKFWQLSLSPITEVDINTTYEISELNHSQDLYYKSYDDIYMNSAEKEINCSDSTKFKVNTGADKLWRCRRIIYSS